MCACLHVRKERRMADGRENHPSLLPAAGATGAGGGTSCHLPLIIITVAAEPGGEGGMAAQGGRRNLLLNLFENYESTPLPPRTRAALPAPTGVPCLPPSDGPPDPRQLPGQTGGSGRGSPAPKASCLLNAPPPAACAGRPGAVGGWEGQRETLAPADVRLPRERVPGPGQPPARRIPRFSQPQADHLGPGRLNFPAGGPRGTWVLPAPSLHQGYRGREGVPQKIKRGSAPERRRRR